MADLPLSQAPFGPSSAHPPQQAISHSGNGHFPYIAAHMSQQTLRHGISCVVKGGKVAMQAKKWTFCSLADDHDLREKGRVMRCLSALLELPSRHIWRFCCCLLLPSTAERTWGMLLAFWLLPPSYNNATQRTGALPPPPVQPCQLFTQQHPPIWLIGFAMTSDDTGLRGSCLCVQGSKETPLDTVTHRITRPHEWQKSGLLFGPPRRCSTWRL
jgi:hypothetical protein